MKKHLKIVILYIGSLLFSVAPLVMTMTINRGEYFGTPAETLKLCTGGMIATVFIVFKVIGHLKMPSGITLYGVIFVMAYLLEALLNDLMLLSGMALLGEIVDAVIFRPLIKKHKEERIAEKTATETAKQLRSVMQEFSGRT